jgi:hypothetical protein
VVPTAHEQFGRRTSGGTMWCDAVPEQEPCQVCFDTTFSSFLHANFEPLHGMFGEAI